MPYDFWDFTLREVLCLIEGERSRDEMMWNHTSSLLSMTAQVNAKKGKTFSPADFHPYISEKRKKQSEYDVSSKEGIMNLAERFRTI